MDQEKKRAFREALQQEPGPVGAADVRKCPTCGKDLSDGLYARQSFCSKRCREMDLLKWLNEEYRIPVEDPDPQGPMGDES